MGARLKRNSVAIVVRFTTNAAVRLIISLPVSLLAGLGAGFAFFRGPLPLVPSTYTPESNSRMPLMVVMPPKLTGRMVELPASVRTVLASTRVPPVVVVTRLSPGSTSVPVPEPEEIVRGLVVTSTPVGARGERQGKAVEIDVAAQ